MLAGFVLLVNTAGEFNRTLTKETPGLSEPSKVQRAFPTS
jgi:hypothetical protein